MRPLEIIPEIPIETGLSIIREAYKGYAVKMEIDPHADFPFFIRIEGHGTSTSVSWQHCFGGAMSLLGNRVPNLEKTNQCSNNEPIFKCSECGKSLSAGEVNHVGSNPIMHFCYFCFCRLRS